MSSHPPPLSTTKFVLEKRQNKKQVGENLFLPRRGPFCPWSANRESKLLNKWSFPGGSSLRRADVSSSLITTEGRSTRRKRSLSGDERGETSAVRRPGGGGGGEGGIFSIMVYTGRLALRPKGVHLSGFRYMKGWRFYSLKYLKGEGNRSFWSVKGPKRTNG